MVALVALVSKGKQPIGKLLLKALDQLKQKRQGKYTICINNKVFYEEKSSSFEIPSRGGDNGIGLISLDAQNSPSIATLEFKLEKGFLAYKGQLYDQRNKSSNTQSSNKQIQISTIDDIKTLFKKYFDENDIKNSIKKILNSLTEGFVFILQIKDKLVIARDVIGFIPIYIAENDEIIACATEKKSLWELGFGPEIRSILPGECVVMTYNQSTSFNLRDTIQNKTIKTSFEESLSKVEKLLKEAILKRAHSNEIALLFSGGLDSTILASLIKELGFDLQLFTASFSDGKDLINAKTGAEQLDLPLTIFKLTDDKIRNELRNIIYHLEDWDSLKVEIGIPIYFATQLVSDQGFDSVFAGQGADELFAGYNRYERILKTKDYQGLQDMLYHDILNLWHHDLERDNKITQTKRIDLKLPYLDFNFMQFCLTIPPEYKLIEQNGSLIRKYLLIKLGKQLGLAPDILTKPKIAMQYGSGSAKSLKRIASTMDINGEMAKSFGLNSSTEVITNAIYQILGFPNSAEIPNEIMKKIRSSF
jgi:asparagine synthase (glutamine-hydrolysing)